MQESKLIIVPKTDDTLHSYLHFFSPLGFLKNKILMLKFAHKPSNAEIDLLPWTDSLKFFIHLICIFFSPCCRWKIYTSTQNSSPLKMACWLQLWRPRGPSWKRCSSPRSTSSTQTCHEQNKPKPLTCLFWSLFISDCSWIKKCWNTSRRKKSKYSVLSLGVWEEIPLKEPSCRLNTAEQPEFTNYRLLKMCGELQKSTMHVLETCFKYLILNRVRS